MPIIQTNPNVIAKLEIQDNTSRFEWQKRIFGLKQQHIFGLKQERIFGLKQERIFRLKQ